MKRGASTMDFADSESGGALPVPARVPNLAVDFFGPQATIRAGGFSVDFTNTIRAYAHDDGDLSALLRVTVVQDQTTFGDELPDVAGRYTMLQGALSFAPLMPFENDVPYRAVFDSQRLGRDRESSEIIVLDFSIAGAPASEAPEMLHVYPSSERLPENLLRFYIRFSNPMQRGLAEKEIVLVDADGATVADALYRAPVELWDRAMRILTVLLDPGRLKRAVGPNRELGPPLAVGATYTLAIGSGMLDSSGRSLPRKVVKTFNVADAVRDRVNVANWALAVPASGTREPLMLTFPTLLDWAILTNSIAVFSSDDRELAGRIVIDEAETRWAFAPTDAWAAGEYYVRVASGLEDVCGNNTLAPFDAGPGTSESQQDLSARRLEFEIA